MTDINHMLDRLLKSAQTAPPPPAADLSWKSRMEVLAAWRRARAQDEWASLMPTLRRVVAIACCAAALALAFNLAVKSQAPDEFAALNATVNLAAIP